MKSQQRSFPFSQHNLISSSRRPQHQHGKGARQGGGGTGGQESRHHCHSTRPPQKILNRNTVACKVKKENQTPSERILWMISCQSFVQAREAPVNDKATEKHHWPGPGTNRGQGKWYPRGSLPAHHPNILQVPCPRQESRFTTSSECPARLWLREPASPPFSRSTEAKELQGELGGLELPKLRSQEKYSPSLVCHLS